MRRARLVVAYDGTDFHGFAPNVGVRTVLGELSAAISLVVRTPVELTGAGRTDAGVHAWGQVVSGDLPADTDLADLARRVNKMCGPEIAVRDAEWASPDFDARFSAHVAALPLPRVERSGAEPARGADVVARAAAARRVGDAGGRRPADRRARLRVVLPAAEGGRRRAGAEPRASRARPRVDAARRHADAAVRHPGDVVLPPDGAQHRRHDGRRRARHRSAGELAAILRARDRNVAGQVAPPTGLVLWEVGYVDEQ